MHCHAPVVYDPTDHRVAAGQGLSMRMVCCENSPMISALCSGDVIFEILPVRKRSEPTIANRWRAPMFAHPRPQETKGLSIRAGET